MKNLIYFIGVSFFSIHLYSQSGILDSLKSKSEVIAYVKITGVTVSGDSDVGATEVYVSGEVQHLYKGNLNKKNTLDFTMIVHHVNPIRVSKDKEYIVFLKKIDWIIAPEEAKKNAGYTLTDWLFGVQPYFLDLHNQLIYH